MSRPSVVVMAVCVATSMLSVLGCSQASKKSENTDLVIQNAVQSARRQESERGYDVFRAAFQSDSAWIVSSVAEIAVDDDWAEGMRDAIYSYIVRYVGEETRNEIDETTLIGRAKAEARMARLSVALRVMLELRRNGFGAEIVALLLNCSMSDDAELRYVAHLFLADWEPWISKELSGVPGSPPGIQSLLNTYPNPLKSRVAEWRQWLKNDDAKDRLDRAFLNMLEQRQ